MNEEHVREWVAALRSGDYKQGQNYLHQGDSFCCLGVVCALAGCETGVDNPATNVITYEGMVSVLPIRALEWLGLPAGGEFGGDPTIGKYTAIELNDDQNLTFEEIAAEIEENWL